MPKRRFCQNIFRSKILHAGQTIELSMLLKLHCQNIIFRFFDFILTLHDGKLPIHNGKQEIYFHNSRKFFPLHDNDGQLLLIFCHFRILSPNFIPFTISHFIF